MNFDDLHDPNPPRPGSDTLAAVAGRARQIRRRRTALVVGGGVLAVLAVAVPTALAVTGEDTSDRMTPATVPTHPETTVTVSPTMGSEPLATVAPTSAPPSTTSITTVPATLPSIAAIRADGDAVLIAPDGTETVVYDGADPRVQPAEGELRIVDSVVVAADGSTFVSTCCEPVPGSWFEVGDADGFGGYGHGLAVSPDGTRVAMAGASSAWVIDTAGVVVSEMSSDSYTPANTQLEQAMWLGDDEVVLLLLQEGTFSLARVVAEPLGAMLGGANISVDHDLTTPWPQLAGVGADGSVLVFQATGEGATATALQAHDQGSLERREASDVPIPEPAIFASLHDGVLTWIGVDGSLHVGDTLVPGEYRWARPIRG